MIIKKYNISKIITSLILGLNSGLTYALLGSSFTAYLHDNKLDLTIISLMSIRMLPYSFKCLWSSFIDNLNIAIFPKNFGQRKMWIIFNQLLLIFSIFLLGIINIKTHFNAVFAISIILAFFAASYDIAMEAYRIELFTKEELNKGSLANILGFRIGLLITGAGGLLASHYMSWSSIFVITAILILPCMFIIYNSKDNRIIEEKFFSKENWVEFYLLEPLKTLYNIKNFFLVILTIGFYKLSDNYLDIMLIPFLINIGYSKIQIAIIVKTIGIGANIVGAVIGSTILNCKFNIIKYLFYIEILAALSNLLFILLVNSKINSFLLTIIVVIENMVSGLSNIILINYMSSLCNKKFTATHYSILVTISGIFRNIISLTAGHIARDYGWHKFFLISSFLSTPSLICLVLLSLKINYNKKIS